jgi:asparagine synthase (glutamine-hydrolysing)
MTVDGSDVRVREYWRLDPEREVRFRRDEEYAEAFRDLFVEAVRCRLRALAPVGLTLSGGLDSSSVAATARGLSAGTLHAFTWAFDGLPECDERDYVDAVLASGGFDARTVRFGDDGPLGWLEAAVADLGEPCMVQNIHLWRTTYRAARDLGIRVMLDGHDGDSVVSHGAGYLDTLARSGRWLRLAREARLIARRRNQSAKPIVKEHLRRHVAMPLWKASLAVRGRSVPPAEAGRPASILDADFAKRVAPRVRPAGHTHYDLLTSDFLRYATEALDATSGVLGVEPRHPFLDRRVVEFCLALPPDQKLWQGWGRGILRRAMEGILAERIRWRVGKTRLGAQFDRAMRSDRTILEGVLATIVEPLAPYVDMGAFRDHERRYLTDGEKAAGAAMWNAVTLGLWLRSHGYGG